MFPFLSFVYGLANAVDAQPRSENRRQAFIRPPIVATLSHTSGPLEAPLDGCAVVHAELRVLSLSMEECRSTFGGVAGILAKF